MSSKPASYSPVSRSSKPGKSFGRKASGSKSSRTKLVNATLEVGSARRDDRSEIVSEIHAAPSTEEDFPDGVDAHQVDVEEKAKDAECATCGKKLIEPRYLDCGHAYCGPPNKCWRALQKKGKIFCPICRLEHKGPDEDMRSSVLDQDTSFTSFGSRSVMTVVPDLCETHKRWPLALHCEQCFADICKQCWETKHNTKGHTVEFINVRKHRIFKEKLEKCDIEGKLEDLQWRMEVCDNAIESMGHLLEKLQKERIMLGNQARTLEDMEATMPRLHQLSRRPHYTDGDEKLEKFMATPDQVFGKRHIVLHKADLSLLEDIKADIHRMLGTGNKAVLQKNSTHRSSVWQMFSNSPSPSSPKPGASVARKAAAPRGPSSYTEIEMCDEEMTEAVFGDDATLITLHKSTVRSYKWDDKKDMLKLLTTVEWDRKHKSVNSLAIGKCKGRRRIYANVYNMYSWVNELWAANYDNLEPCEQLATDNITEGKENWVLGARENLLVVHVKGTQRTYVYHSEKWVGLLSIAMPAQVVQILLTNDMLFVGSEQKNTVTGFKWFKQDSKLSLETCQAYGPARAQGGYFALLRNYLVTRDTDNNNVLVHSISDLTTQPCSIPPQEGFATFSARCGLENLAVAGFNDETRQISVIRLAAAASSANQSSRRQSIFSEHVFMPVPS